MKWIVIIALAGCGGSVPQTRYYQLAAPTAPARPSSGELTIAVEPLTADGAYGDERIVYRLDPVRLDYYDYHRWSTAPGAMIGGYLEQALARSGEFSSVTHAPTATTAVVLGGRVTALEEVDVDAHHWVGHIAVELTLRDAKSGAIVWAQTFDEREPEPTQSPEGLARAVGIAMGRIVRDAAPQLSRFATQARVARQLE
jgi:ABC-type uncharacterized transport system auxiliary subunit